MEQLILFFGAFIIISVLSYFLTIKKTLKRNGIPLPTELALLNTKYGVKFDVIGLKKPLYLTTFANAFIISVTIVVISFFEKQIIKIGIGIVIIIPLLLIAYKIISIILKRGTKKKNV